MNAAVDEDRCRGHGVCVATCPEVFALTDDGYAEARTGDVPGTALDDAEEAAAACPEQAITITR